MNAVQMHSCLCSGGAQRVHLFVCFRTAALTHSSSETVVCFSTVPEQKEISEWDKHSWSLGSDVFVPAQVSA